ncbi:MAG: putative lipid II flippase FtsW [Clostridia bacterium]|nr:putative lipid II flippase FtsW [Deltaproteobacteria bacterium]
MSSARALDGRRATRGEATHGFLDRFSGLDFSLIAVVVAMVSLGLVLVYSASSVYAEKNFGDAESFLRAQLRALAIGSFAMLGLTQVPTAWLRANALRIFGVCTLLCLIVLIPHIGHVAGGARRWLQIGRMGFQPSEVAKLAVLIMLAAVLARREEAGARGKLVIPVLLAQIPVGLVLAEPDLGTALVIELILGTMIFAAGLRLRTIALMGLAALPVFYHLVMGTPFRLQRLLGYIDPWAYRSTVGYQVTESLISIGSGGITGLGLGDGKHKMFFLPEAHTDFIFAILGEELGLIGVFALLASVGFFIWRGLAIARETKDPFAAYLAVGVVGLIGIPAIFNTCVATGLLPTKGLPLPFVSYGGSNLLVALAGTGLLLRVGKENAK